MPIYEYQCNECEKEFEFWAGRDAVLECPGCGSTDVKKTISRFGFKIEPKKDGTWVSGHEKKN